MCSATNDLESTAFRIQIPKSIASQPARVFKLLLSDYIDPLEKRGLTTLAIDTHDRSPEEPRAIQTVTLTIVRYSGTSRGGAQMDAFPLEDHVTAALRDLVTDENTPPGTEKQAQRQQSKHDMLSRATVDGHLVNPPEPLPIAKQNSADQTKEKLPISTTIACMDWESGYVINIDNQKFMLHNQISERIRVELPTIEIIDPDSKNPTLDMETHKLLLDEIVSACRYARELLSDKFALNE